LLSGVRPLAEINTALDDLAAGTAIRQILLPPEA
jgi:Zn-dependent alcohol dehydrogenase